MRRSYPFHYARAHPLFSDIKHIKHIKHSAKGLKARTSKAIFFLLDLMLAKRTRTDDGSVREHLMSGDVHWSYAQSFEDNASLEAPDLPEIVSHIKVISILSTEKLDIDHRR